MVVLFKQRSLSLLLPQSRLLVGSLVLDSFSFTETAQAWNDESDMEGIAAVDFKVLGPDNGDSFSFLAVAWVAP